MKRLALLLGLAACAALVGSRLLAQELPKPPGEGDIPKEVKKEGQVKKEQPPTVKLPEIVARMDKVVGLTEVQKAQIIELNKAREAAIKAANDKFRAEVDLLLTPEQKAKWDEAAKEPVKKPDVNKNLGDKPIGDKPLGDKPKEGAPK